MRELRNQRFIGKSSVAGGMGRPRVLASLPLNLALLPSGAGGRRSGKGAVNGSGGSKNLSSPSSFIANAHNEIYAFYTEKSGFLKKI